VASLSKVYWPVLKLYPFRFSRDTVNFTRDATNLSGSLTKFSGPAINFDNFDKPLFIEIGYRIIVNHTELREGEACPYMKAGRATCDSGACPCEKAGRASTSMTTDRHYNSKKQGNFVHMENSSSQSSHSVYKFLYIKRVTLGVLLDYQ